jgi:PAS domain S-box-containing protein
MKPHSHAGLFPRDGSVIGPGDRAEDDAQARLAAIVDSSDDAIVSQTLDGVITSWNAAAERMFGYSAAEAIGRHITLIVPDVRHHEVAGVLERVGRGERVHHFETVRRTRDGRHLDISLSVSPVKNATGTIIGASKIARDITGRREAERILATTVHRLEVLYRLADGVGRAKTLGAVCEAAVDAVMAVGADRASVLAFDDAGVMRFRAWRNLSDGYRAAVDGHSPWSRNTPAPAPILVEDVLSDPHLGALRDVVAGEGIRALAFVPLVSQGLLLGKFMIYHDAAHAFSPAELRLAETIAQHVAAGLSRVLAEASIEDLLGREQAARREADAANRGKDQFLAILSHELRTPLNAILGWARMLRGGILSERERAHAIEVIERNADLQGQLIGDLLDISRIAVGKMELERAPVDLLLVARQAVESVVAAADAKKLHLAIELTAAACEVLGDARRLQQVFSNLLQNAIKFTPEGGRIELRLSRHEASARVTVTDTGEGIDPAMLGRIFDLFEQADSSTTRGHGGLGLGLAIARQVVELHGGAILAESEGPGKGSRFTIDFPVLAVRGAVPSEARAETTGSPERLRGHRILLVDDQQDALDLLAFVLRRSGADVRIATSGEQALRALAAEDFGGLVSDIAMPDLDGFALIRQVRATARPAAGRLRAVALTAHSSAGVRLRALAAGFDACATKPVDAEELIEVLARLP